MRGVAVGRFFTGALSTGIAVIEGFDTFRLLRLVQGGVTPVDEPYRVKFDRITRIAAGDFDGDGFTDVAITAEHRGRSTGEWTIKSARKARAAPRSAGRGKRPVAGICVMK